MVSRLNYAIALLFILIFSSCTSSRNHTFEEREKVHADEISSEVDSIAFIWDFYPERWNINGDMLWVINSRDSLFLSGYDLRRDSLLCRWGYIGNGPDDFISPGIVEGLSDDLKLYGNTECKVVGYAFDNGTLSVVSRGKLPVWNNEKSIPKPYTRISRINDSIGVGTYFFPRKVGADIIDMNTGKLLSEIQLGIEQSEEKMSGPRQFKTASTGDMIITAYRYLDRIEVYRINDKFEAVPVYAIGNSADQSDLYEADRDNEMVKYYSDVQCDKKYAYLLWHGVEEQNLETSPTRLLIYDMATGENIRNILLDRYYEQLLTDGDGRIMLWSPLAEDNIYSLRLQSSGL